MAINTNFPNVRPSLLLDFSNSQQLDPRVTFSRSTTAPYYDGKTSVLAEQNLILQSQLFTNANWTATGIGTPVVGATAPDGTTTAYTLTATATTGYHILGLTNGIPISNGVNYTLSAYVQAGTNNFVSLTTNQTNNNSCTAVFNLTSGSVAFSQQTTYGTYTYVGNSITQVGSTSLYRIALTFSTTTGSSGIGFTVQLNNSATPTISSGNAGLQSWTALGTETIIAWGCQLEQRSSVTAYNATTTTAITNYIPQLLTAPINAPRFDFNPTTGESLGLLIEQSSTNTALYSSLFSNAVWVGGLSVSATANIAPDGTQTANLVTAPTTGSYTFYQAVTATGTAQTYTIYAKKYSGNTIANAFILRNSTTSTNLVGCVIDYDTGILTQTVGSGGISSTSVGNGWWRISLTASSGITVGNNLLIYAGFNGGTYTANTGAYFFGAQLEALAFPTSYIATTTAQVTRASDNASMTGTNFTSWYNPYQGTVYGECTSSSGSFTDSVLFGGNSNGYQLRLISSIPKTAIRAVVDLITTGTTLSNIATTGVKIAGFYQSGNNAATGNGNTATTSTTNFIINTPPTSVAIGYDALTGGTYLNGRIKKIAYYPLVVTSAQLQALTGT